MKNLTAFMLALLMTLSVNAAYSMDKVNLEHKLYHYGIHVPVQIVTFLYNWPVLALRYADDKADKALYSRTTDGQETVEEHGL